MVPAKSNRVKYYTSLGGYSVYNGKEINLGRFRDCIIVYPLYCPNIMIIDHIPAPGDSAGWSIIKGFYYESFKLISEGNPCSNCKNVYECAFTKDTKLSDCFEACGPLLKKQEIPAGFEYVKVGYATDPFSIPNLSNIMLQEAAVNMRTKEIRDAVDRGRYTKEFKTKYCVDCVYSCAHVPNAPNGRISKFGSAKECHLTQKELYNVLDEEIKIRFGSYETAMGMLINCGDILWIGKYRYVVACPVTSKYYLLRGTSRPFALKLLESKYLSIKDVTCSEKDIMNLRTMVAYQNSVNMFLQPSNDWRVFFKGYILPMAFIGANGRGNDLAVYCKQPTKHGRKIYYQTPEQVIQIQCCNENFDFSVLYPFHDNRAGIKNHKPSPSRAIVETKRLFKTPEKCLQTWNATLYGYENLEVIDNPNIKRRGDSLW